MNRVYVSQSSLPTLLGSPFVLRGSTSVLWVFCGGDDSAHVLHGSAGAV